VSRENVFEAQMKWDAEDPDGFRAGVADISKALGITDLAVRIFDVPPGQSVCPYHYEYEQEWLLVLEGSIVLRSPGGEEVLSKGDITAFPAGPSGAHKTTNRGDHAARLMMFSSARVPALAVYPDSDKLGVFLDDGDAADEVLLHRRDGSVGYYDGEV
jgi:uncharacterized cupin superfamily protein